MDGQQRQRELNNPSPARSIALVATLALASACGGHEASTHDAVIDAPLLIDVPRGEVVSGFVQGRLRRTAELQGFRITQHPITNVEHQACVDAGRCAEPAADACRAGALQALGSLVIDEEDAPALCVGVKAAEAFCEWVGGRLPVLSEWLYAARGTEPQPYAWGSQSASCERHARTVVMAPPGPDDVGKPVRFAPCASISDEGVLRIGRHEAGASPLGLQDVLLSPAELVASAEGSHFGACDPRFEGCIVVERQPGEIASVAPIARDSADHAYSFRCVMEAE